MPLYVADYLADTRRLTTLEHGVYMLLIMDYWRNGPPPDNDDVLARVVGLTQENWKCARIAIEPLFCVEGGKWAHKRIEEELVKSSEKSNKARLSAANRWKDKKKLDNANAMPTQCEGNANAMLSQPQPQLDIPVSTKQATSVLDEDPKAVLFGEAADWLAKQTGKGIGSVKSSIGQMLKLAGGDGHAGFVLGVIRDARRERKSEPIAWAMGMIRDKRGGSIRGVMVPSQPVATAFTLSKPAARAS